MSPAVCEREQMVEEGTEGKREEQKKNRRENWSVGTRNREKKKGRERTQPRLSTMLHTAFPFLSRRIRCAVLPVSERVREEASRGEGGCGCGSEERGRSRPEVCFDEEGSVVDE